MSFIQKQVASLIIVGSVLFFSASALADDGLTPGPGLFSGESGEFSLTAMLDLKSAKPREDLQQPEDNIINTRSSKFATQRSVKNSKTEVQVADFKSYQEWRELRDADPELYTDFKMYLDYKAFLKLQKKN
jgi:hypothetical protein